MDSTAVRIRAARPSLPSFGPRLWLLLAVSQGASGSLLLEPLVVVTRVFEVLLDRRGHFPASAREALVPELGLRDRVVVRDIARVGEDVAVRQAKEVVELADPVRHVHRLAVE